MAKSPKGRSRKAPLPNPRNEKAFAKWLQRQPPQWSLVIATRAALRALPLGRTKENNSTILGVFRAMGIARFVSIHLNPAQAAVASNAAVSASESFLLPANDIADYAAFAAAAYADPSNDADDALSAYAAETTIATAGIAPAEDVSAMYASVLHDVRLLHDEMVAPQHLAEGDLWAGDAPARIGTAWKELKSELLIHGSHWYVWADWYEDALWGIRRSEAEHAAFTDAERNYPWLDRLPWSDGAKAVNTAIAQRLEALKPDPESVQGVPSPIAISRTPDGRIGADAGALATPSIPSSVSPQEHARALSACRSRAEQLGKTATSPQFNGRKDYGEALAAYLEWLPTEANTGNILLADGEARVLTKLFTADQAILATGFATGLSVLLEDHIGLRAFYPEVERHYHAVRTGRIAAPLSLDAIEGIRKAIHASTPDVFHESVAPAMDETAKPVPDAKPLPTEEAPPLEPGQPRPPKDPIADVDPAKSRTFTFASAANRIWELLRQGKDIPKAREGWGKAYGDIKEHIGPIVNWLKDFWPSS